MHDGDHQLQLSENLSTALVLLDDQLMIKYMNPAAENLLATSSQRAYGSSAKPFFGNAPERIAALKSALRHSQPFTERKARLNLSDHTHTTVDFTVSPFTDSGKKYLLLELQPMERILRISREEALLSAHDTSRNLIRGLAHEIKNPLGGIRGAAQLLAAELSGRDVQEYTDIITAEVERLCRLVDQLLGPNQPLKFSRVNIHEVIEHVATLVTAETRGVLTILRDYDPSIPELIGNREQLIQAVLNIVRNAMQALEGNNMLSQGKITLRTRIQRHITIGKTNHRVLCRLDIIDNGPGIPADIADRIFYPMISGRPEGSGLGLPIAQSAINHHQGLIECESVPGHTRFSIYLPIDHDHD